MGENKKTRRVLYRLLMVVMAAGIMALLLAGGLLQERLPAESEPDAVPVVQSSTVPTSTTTITAPATTTTTTRVPTQPSLLQYDPTGHYVQPVGAAWNLLLVNDWNALPDDYDQQVRFVDAGNRLQQVDGRMLSDLNAMLQAGELYGIDVQSGYRPASQQNTLYWRQVNNFRRRGYEEEDAQRAAGTVVKRPGYSEHNTGLAVDLGGSGNFKLEEDFSRTKAYTWLMENCADYGFILRFPKDKEAITGVIYEPWHYRYVGREAATYIMENNLCLEEYLEQTGQ